VLELVSMKPCRMSGAAMRGSNSAPFGYATFRLKYDASREDGKGSTGNHPANVLRRVGWSADGSSYWPLLQSTLIEERALGRDKPHLHLRRRGVVFPPVPQPFAVAN
jgi:hypothetical protein